MKRIREARDVSRQDIQRATRITPVLIASFEEDGLFDHPSFNRVYLRSLVRAYAECVDLPPDRALDALDRALDGNYQHEMATQFLGSSPPAEDVPREASGASDAEDEVESDGSSGEEGATEEDSEASDQEDAAHDDASADTATRWGIPSEEPARSPEPSSVAGDAASPEASSPSAKAQTAGSTRAAGGAPSSDGAAGTRRWLVLLAGVVAVGLLVGVGWWMYAQLGAPPSSPVVPPADTLTRADTMGAAVDTAAAPPAPPLADVSIGEVMELTVIATGRVSPIRVQRDSDLRRPYWINAGEAKIFQARSRFVLEEALDSIRVRLEGYPYPLRPGADGRAVISRDSALIFVDSLRGEPPRPVPSPDTIPLPPASL